METNKKKIVWMLIMVMAMSMFISACSLFGGDEKEEGSLPELKKRFYYIPGEHFVVNLKVDEDAKASDSEKETTTKTKKTPPLCKAGVSLLTIDKDMSTDLEQNQPAIRNICLQILREQTESEARADNAIEKLEKEMTKQLKDFLDMEEFYGVYISDFVVQ